MVGVRMGGWEDAITVRDEEVISVAGQSDEIIVCLCVMWPDCSAPPPINYPPHPISDIRENRKSLQLQRLSLLLVNKYSCYSFIRRNLTNMNVFMEEGF